MLKFLQPLQQSKIEIAHRLGADVAINYKEESVQEYVQKHTNGNGFEVIFDTVGGKISITLSKLLQSTELS